MRKVKITPSIAQEYVNCIPQEVMPLVLNESARAVGAMMGNTPCGAIVWEEDENREGVLRSIFVLPEARGLGYGSALLRECKDSELVFSYEATEDRDSLEGFFENNNVHTEPELIRIGRLNLGELIRVLREKGIDKASNAGLFYEEMLSEEKRIANAWLQEEYGERLFPYTGTKPPSIFLITENRLKNILLFKSTSDRVISIDYLYSEKGEEPKVSGMLKKTIQLLERQYPANTRIEMLLCGDQLEKMYKNLFGMPEDYMLVVSGKVIGSRLWDIDY